MRWTMGSFSEKRQASCWWSGLGFGRRLGPGLGFGRRLGAGLGLGVFGCALLGLVLGGFAGCRSHQKPCPPCPGSGSPGAKEAGKPQQHQPSRREGSEGAAKGRDPGAGEDTEEGGAALKRIMTKRRSRRSFTGEGLSRRELMALAWAAQGVTSKRGKRTTPSAGATYPLEVYLFTPKGTFHYNPGKNTLVKLRSGDERKALARACHNQSAVLDAGVNLLIAADVSRTAKKYGDRARRYVWMEAGHCAQNIHLMATSLGLGAVPVGAFVDQQVLEVAKLPKGQVPLYIMSVGKNKP